MIFIKKLFLITIIFFLLFNQTYAVDLTEFTSEIKKYSNEYFPELSDDNLLTAMSSASNSLNTETFIKRILGSITKEFRNNISLIFKVIGIAILCSILKNIQSNLGESGISEIAFYVCYILIVVLIMTSFTNIINVCKSTIVKLSDFMKVLIPVVISLMLVTGNIATVAVVEPILLSMISIITALLSNFVIPAIFISTIINIISNMSEHVNVKKIGETLRKCSLWCMEIALIIFVGVLSLEGT